MLKLTNIKKIYNTESTIALGLDNTNLQFSNCEFVAITGKSGSGKSTLMNIISGLDTYTEGEMEFLGDKTSYFHQSDFENYTNTNVGFILQQYNLIETFTVYETIRQCLVFSKYEGEYESRINKLLEKVDLLPKSSQKVSTLSGGEKQRLVIAKAFSKDLRIIVADEPTANLDNDSAQLVINLLNELSKTTLVFIVTHNFKEVEQYVTRKLELRDGVVVSDELLNTQNEVFEVKEINYTKNISLLSSIILGFKFASSSIKRLVLQLVMVLCMTLIITIYYKDITTEDDYFYSYNYKDAMNFMEDRIMVKSFTDEYLSPEQISEISEVEGVNVITDDYFLYMNYSTSYRISSGNNSYGTGVDYMYNESNIEDGKVDGNSIIGKSSGLVGNEIISPVHSKDEIGDTVELTLNLTSRKTATIEVVIVGVIDMPDNYEYDAFVVSQDLISEISDLNGVNGLYEISNDTSSFYFSNSKVEIAELADNEILLPTYYMTRECYFNDIIDIWYQLDQDDIDTCITYIESLTDLSGTMNYSIDSYYAVPKEFNILFDIDNYSIEDYMTSGTVYISENNYNTFKSLQNTQVSVFVEDMSNYESVKQELRELGYLVFDARDYMLYNEETVNVLNEIVMFIVRIMPIIIVSGVFAMFMTLIFTRKTQELVLTRSIGASKRDLSRIQFTEYTLTGILAIVVASILYDFLYDIRLIHTQLSGLDNLFISVAVLVSLFVIVKVFVSTIYKKPIYSQLKRNN